MPEDLHRSLIRMQYEEPTRFGHLQRGADAQTMALVQHLRSLDIPCDNGPPLPRCTWIPVFSTGANPNPEFTTAALSFALATPTDVRRTVSQAAEPGMKVDATYVRYDGKDLLFTVLCDQLMDDDWDDNAEPIAGTPGRLGRAVEQAAQPSKTPVRHWRLAGGGELWEAAIAEEQAWIKRCLKQDPGPDKDFRSGLEAIG